MAVQPKVFTFRADLDWEEGRSGVATAEGRPAIGVAPPAGFPGGEAALWSPEHLYLASLQSCTMVSFVNHCAHRDIEVCSYRSSAQGEITRRDEDRRYAFVRIAVTVMARVGEGSVEAARALTDAAERDCFVSASTTAEVETDWRIIA